MKLIYIIFILIVISCSSSTDRDHPPTVVNPIADITSGIEEDSTVIDLLQVFADSDDDVIHFEVSGTSSSIVSPNIKNNKLILVYNSELGDASILISASANGEVVMDEFIVHRINNSVQLISTAGTLFSSKDYLTAENAFRFLTFNSDDDIKAQAYLGLGFSLLRQEKLDDAYSSLSEGALINNSTVNIDLIAGLSTLEYHYKNNLDEAISNGLSVISVNESFSMMYDSSYDIKDVRLVVARSYFDQTEYSKCLLQVKALSKLESTTESDTELYSKLLNALDLLDDELK